MNDPLTVAKKVLQAALANLEHNSHCDFCEAGTSEDDDAKLHSDECPLFGYDKTVDFERLKAWTTV